MRAVPFLVSETSSWLGYCFRRHDWGECSHGLKTCRLPPAGKPIRHDKKSDKSFAHFRLFFIANSLAHFNGQNDRVLQSVYNQCVAVGSTWWHSFSRRFCLRRLSRHRAIIIFSPRDCYLFVSRLLSFLLATGALSHVEMVFSVGKSGRDPWENR